LIAVTAICGLVTNATAQRQQLEPKKDKCQAPSASHVYFVDSGQGVTVVHPGPNGGNGYQINIMGNGVDNFEVEKMPFMTSLNPIPNYTNATSAKWGLEFAPNNAQYIRAIRMKNKCTGETKAYKLDATIQLTN
jgi:hypothetical protein